MHPAGVPSRGSSGDHVIELPECRPVGGDGGRDDVVHGGGTPGSKRRRGTDRIFYIVNHIALQMPALPPDDPSRSWCKCRTQHRCYRATHPSPAALGIEQVRNPDSYTG